MSSFFNALTAPLSSFTDANVSGPTGNLSDLASYISSQADSVYNYVPPVPTNVSVDGPSWTDQLTKLIPGFATTAENILTRAFSVPQLAPGQFLSTAPNGAMTTYQIPTGSNSGFNLPGVGGGSGIFVIGGLALLALLIFKKH